MYFSGDLTIDPSQMTKFKRVKPTKAFGKLFFYLTAGATGTKKETETFTAVSVLQSLNQALRQRGIDNIVRLARDAEDLYLDTQGRKDDLEEAMASFEAGDTAKEFDLLQLVVEHEDEALKYLLDVRVRRQHAPGEYPISVHLNGVIKDLRVDPMTGTAEEVKGKLASVFADQTSYDAYVAAKKAHFDAFVEQLKAAIQQHIAADDVSTESTRRLVRPKSKKGKVGDIDHDYDDPTVEPVHAGYPGFDGAFFYAWVWSELCFDHNIHIADTTIVDDGGHAMMDVGASGFDAGESDALLPGEEFEPPVGEDITYHADHAFSEQFESANVVSSSGDDTLESDSGGGGWLDAFTSGSDSGGSSCGSSCGGCGGGD